MQLGICSWSLHRNFEQGLTLAEYLRLARETFGVDWVDLCHRHLPSTEPSGLDEAARLLEKNSIGLSAILLDGCAAAVPDADFDHMINWFDIAKRAGAKAVRINTGGDHRSDESVELGIRAYRILAEAAQARDLLLLIENHGGISADPDRILQTLDAVGNPNLKVCADFGNFNDDIRYEGLKKLEPYAYTVHVKTYEFDENGEEVKYNFEKAMQAFQGFEGIFSVEFEGFFSQQPDEIESVRKTIDLVKKHYVPQACLKTS